jgi:hypothetical protein
MPCPICDQKPMNCDCTEAEQRMYAEIEELREQVPQWISVSDRLPERNEPVCVAVGGRVTVGTYSPMMDDWWALIVPTSGVVPTDRVTHWMPLPGPPLA